jgi:hypothetical protein
MVAIQAEAQLTLLLGLKWVARDNLKLEKKRSDGPSSKLLVPNS